MKNKILYIGGFELPDKNAAAQRVMANAKLLREIGFDVSFIGISKDVKTALSNVDGFESMPIPYPTGNIEWIHQICTFININRILERKPHYVILYNFPSIASLKILKACHKNGIKVIHDLTEWETVSGWSMRSIIRRADINLRMHYCIKKMDGVIAISKYLFDYYKNVTNCIFVPPTIDIQAEKWKRNSSNNSHNKIKLIYAGTAGYGCKDRLDYIIDALKGKEKLELTVIGMTKEEYERGYSLQVPDQVNVNFKGRLPHLDTIKAVQDADFQMLIRDNNKKNSAGFPTKFVESMACGTPIIATLSSNIGDFLKDGINGVVVSDSKQLEIIFSEISNIERKKITEMKLACRNNHSFDYHNYQSVFSNIFKSQS